MNRQSRFDAGYRMLGAGALGWPRGMVWGGRWEGGFKIGNTCTPVAGSCWCMAKPIQYCKVISCQLKYINLNLKKKWKRRVKHWLKTQHSENLDHSIWSHHFMANRLGNSGNSDRLYILVSTITADGDCSHQIKRCLLLGRKVMINLNSILKSRDGGTGIK